MKRLLGRTQINIMNLVGVVAWLVLLSSGSAFGQYDDGGVSATGQAGSKSPATHMRMTMTIEAKGSTVADAIKVLSKKQKQAMIKLEKLEAIEDSIKFGEVTSGGNGDSSAMVRRMQQMLGDDARVKRMLETKPPLTITTEVTADWELKSTEEVNDLLIACDEIRTKISEADVGGTKEDDGLSAEQSELAEELASMMRDYVGEQSGNAGAPEFSYYRLVSPEDHDKLVTEAFKKAKGTAERLVKAISVKQGPLKSVDLSTSGESPAANYGSFYNGYSQSSDGATNVTRDDGTIEVVGSSAGAVAYGLSVSVTYGVE